VVVPDTSLYFRHDTKKNIYWNVDGNMILHTASE